MNIKQLLCLFMISAPFAANADFLSVSAGGGGWNAAPDGNFKKTSDSLDVDVINDLFWDTETQGYAFITFEHFVPVLPNARVMLTQIDQSGSGDTNFVFDNQPYSGNVSNDISIQALDLLLYYEVLDNIVSLDLGLNIRNLKFDYTIISDTTPATTTDSVDETVPMLYVLVGGSPWPDLTLSGELSYVAFSGSSVSDFTAKVAYTTNFFVGFEAGYRIQEYEFDDISGNDASLKFDGVFAGAYLKF